ncbi:Tat pathway signal protein [Veillonella caviae]|uniref:Tat pathway signal protein n=1 Tax=Veillonella caviae TaxID=248316 RepID=UPI002A91AE16|nr:Tat pathway signal protein [Veillonella caviae]MDY5787706.1 Tat pathway signal protein [Veillonella caviae]
MKEYIQFIRHLLWACFFMAIMGSVILYSIGYESYIWGWLWGVIIMIAYTLLLAVQSSKLMSATAENVTARTAINVIQRLILVASMVVIGIKIPSVDVITMGVAIALMQLIMFCMYWLLGNSVMSAKDNGDVNIAKLSDNNKNN